jgi:hypothetical protein
MATTVIDGYTITATFNATYGSVFYTIKNPDGSKLLDASSSAGLFGGLNQLSKKAEDNGNPGLAGQLLNLRSALITALPALDQQAVQEAPSQSPPVSTGAIVANANAAKEDGASSTSPPQGQQVLTPDKRIEPEVSRSGTNAEPTPTSENTPTVGTNGETRPISQTQAINNQNDQLIPGPPNTQASVRAIDNAIAATGGPGAGAPPDDQRGGNNPSGSTSNTVRNRLDELYGGAGNGIVSQPNILDQYASYTYSLSWYLMNPQTYNQTIKSAKKDLNGFYLLAQSGGASSAQGTVVRDTVEDANGSRRTVDTTVGAGRSPFFSLDYYIDNLVVEQIMSGSTTAGGAATTTDISFVVTEPNGISLLPNLNAACKDLYATTGQIGTASAPNYAAATYCMAVRFYGYDENGNLVAPIASTTPTTDRTAAVEKFIFFIISDIKFSVANRLVEYKITGKTSGTATGLSSNRGAIPAQFNFTGTTVNDILVGAVVQQTASQAAGDKTRNDRPIKPEPPVAPNAGRAVVDDNGSFTGESDSPFTVGA